jgi:hypothetical protein
MRSVYSDYTALFAKHKRVIEPLANSLKNQANHFYNQVVCGYKVSDIAHPPNEVLIDDIVLNTVSDLDRIMSYHQVETPTRYKYAAYIGFWWQRGKPFLCKLYDYSAFPKIEDNLLDALFMDLCKSINELFITDFMLSMIRIPPTNSGCANQEKTFSSMDTKDSLHYFLKYRHYTAQELELFLKGLNTCPLAI